MNSGSPFLSIAFAAIVASAAFSAAAAAPVPPQIRNLVSQQRPGTMFVDVTYDLVDPDSASIFVLMEASKDGGTNYNIVTRATSGDIGLVPPGTGKRIVWNAWNDWAGKYTTNAKVRLVADDTATLRPTPPSAPPSPNLVWIPSGAFDMSGTKVYLSQGFWMSKFEVTQAEYQAVMNANPSDHKSPNLPVESLTWDQAVSFCSAWTTLERAASRVPAGWNYRLPTDAEWEYACRAGTTTKYSFGDDPGGTRIGSYVWYSADSGDQTHEVGTKRPNAWGLHDMNGNVWEFCSDWYGALPGGNVTDPKGPPTGFYPVLRGGSLETRAEDCTSAFRHSGATPHWTVGFRVVLAPGS